MRHALNRLCRVVLTIALFPLAAVAFASFLLFFSCVIAWHLPGMIWSQHKWKEILVRQGRYRNPNVVPRELVGGTLIVDNATVGWRVLRCRWTPDSVREITPHVIPTDTEREVHVRSRPDCLEMPFDRWVHSRYLDPESGKAVVLAARRGDRVAAKCLRGSSEADVVRTWSGPIGWRGTEKEDT